MARDLMKWKNPVDSVLKNISPHHSQSTGGASSGCRPPAARTGLFDRKFSAPRPPSGGHTAPSLSINRRFSFPILALLAALAVGLLLLLPGGSLHAQDADPIMYPENGPGAVATFTATDPEGKEITWTLTGDDAGGFTIEGGVLEFMSPPDFEEPADNGTNNTYEITVNASDGINSATEEVEIQVTNVDEPGVVTLSTLQPQVGVPVTATLADPDVAAGTPTWTWYQGSNVIAGASSATYTPLPGDVGFLLKAKATYRDGEDADTDKIAEAASVHAVRAAPDSNIIPTFPDQDLSTAGVQTSPRSVAENTPAGRNIGAPVVATDPGDMLTYTLWDDGGTAQTGDSASFEIDWGTGQIMTKAALNHEDSGCGYSSSDDPTTCTYTVVVRATDPFGAPADVNVTIMVTDVDEDPSITTTTDAFRSLSFAEGTAGAPANIAAALATYAATDLEGETITWDVSGSDAGDFNISASGELTFKAQPDYEAPADANGDNVYEVTVVASDPGRNSDELSVRVTVSNTAETGTITFSLEQPKVGVALTAKLTDPDNVVADSVSWQWENAGTDIEDATSDTYMPTADDVEDTLTVTATYRDGSLAADAR